METITLFEEYRLIERNEAEVNLAWKGAHLLLFFLAFVFGFFCTFCFHMLMHLFDEKCVLFPKLLSLTSLRENIIYEFIPEDKEIANMLPVDFLSTQWVDKSACYLPTYVPLVSGIFGLVWTTMFLMCSTGSRTLTGLQRPWRVLLPVFVFSLAMGGLCLYATIVTHNGLQDLCIKLGEITGSSTCTYSVNVATLTYERRIRGVFQATRITILTAWLHTSCWILSVLLTLVRVLLVVDFQLIKVRVHLKGNIDKMLERYERPIRTVSPDLWINNEISPRSNLSPHSQSSVKVHFPKKEQTSRLVDTSSLKNFQKLSNEEGEILFKSSITSAVSENSLVTSERNKLERILAFNSVPKEKQFIVKMLNDLIDTVYLPDVSTMNFILASTEKIQSESEPLIRQYGQQRISSRTHGNEISDVYVESDKAKEVKLKIESELKKKTNKRFNDFNSGASTSKKAMEFESVMNITSEVKQNLGDNLVSQEKITLKRELSAANVQSESQDKSKVKKSNLKHKNIQTHETAKKSPSPKVQITESRTSVFTDVVYKSSTEILPKAKKEKID